MRALGLLFFAIGMFLAGNLTAGGQWDTLSMLCWLVGIWCSLFIMCSGEREADEQQG